MARLYSYGQAIGEALGDYERAKRVGGVLAKKQLKNSNQTTFRMDREFLNDLGFTKEDLYANIEDLQGVLTKLEEFTWHWDRRGPLSSKPGEPGPIAYIVGHTLVIGPQFADAHVAFLAYSKNQGTKQ
jgi:hypothetical protein